jgi:hypothetical protein
MSFDLIINFKKKQAPITQPNTFRKLNSTIFNGICVLAFFPARQVSEIILNEYSKNTENALWLKKKPQGIYENQSIRGFL